MGQIFGGQPGDDFRGKCSGIPGDSGIPVPGAATLLQMCNKMILSYPPMRLDIIVDPILIDYHLQIKNKPPVLPFVVGGSKRYHYGHCWTISLDSTIGI